jgi:hypothetical protein
MSGNKNNQIDQDVEVRSSPGGGLVQARVGKQGQWKGVVFHGLSNNVLHWLLSASPHGLAICAATVIDPRFADLCQDDLPFPTPTPESIQRGTLSRPEAPDLGETVIPNANIPDKIRTSAFKWRMWVLVCGLLIVGGAVVFLFWWHRGFASTAPDNRHDRVPVRRDVPSQQSDVFKPISPPKNTPRWEDGPMITL